MANGELVVGVDAAGKAGWVAALLGPDPVRFRIGSLAELLDWAEAACVVAVDIPIGSVADGVRACDGAARERLGPRRSSVFAAPPSEVLGAASYEAANADLSARGRPKLSRQAWALVPKINEAALAAATDDRIIEVHPEVSFREMAEADLAWSKKSWNGLMQRRELLAGEGIVIPDQVLDLGSVAADDVVDACAAAWSAQRYASGRARSFPTSLDGHERRPIAIWC